MKGADAGIVQKEGKMNKSAFFSRLKCKILIYEIKVDLIQCSCLVILLKIDLRELPLNIQMVSNAQSNHCQIIEF